MVFATLLPLAAALAHTGDKTMEPTPPLQQDTTPQVPDETKELKARLDRLQLEASILAEENKILKERKERDSLQRDLLAASLPEPKTTPLSGDLTLTGDVWIEAEVMTYIELEDGAKRIALEIAGILEESGSPKSGRWTLIVQDEKDLVALTRLHGLLYRIKLLNKGFDAALEGPAPAEIAVGGVIGAIMLGGKLIGAAADLMSLFRTEASLKATTVTIEPSAVVAELARAFRERPLPVRIVYPALFVPVDTASHESPLLRELRTLMENQAKAAQVEEPDSVRAGRLKDLIQQAERLIKELESGGGPNASDLDALVRAERLLPLYEDGDARIVVLRVLRAGNTNLIRKGRFLTEARLYHSGGVILSYFLFDPMGALLASDVVHETSAYRRVRLQEP